MFVKILCLLLITALIFTITRMICLKLFRYYKHTKRKEILCFVIPIVIAYAFTTVTLSLLQSAASHLEFSEWETLYDVQSNNHNDYAKIVFTTHDWHVIRLHSNQYSNLELYQIDSLGQDGVISISSNDNTIERNAKIFTQAKYDKYHNHYKISKIKHRGFKDTHTFLDSVIKFVQWNDFGEISVELELENVNALTFK
jgi:hypothetical protein